MSKLTHVCKLNEFWIQVCVSFWLYNFSNTVKVKGLHYHNVDLTFFRLDQHSAGNFYHCVQKCPVNLSK